MKRRHGGNEDERRRLSPFLRFSVYYRSLRNLRFLRGRRVLFYTGLMLRLMPRSSFALLFAVLVWSASVLVAQQPALAREVVPSSPWRGLAESTSQAGREGGATTTTTMTPRRGGNPEAANVRNPVTPTPESLAAGKRFYTQFCANCHGPVGKGDGTTAGADPPSDLTDGAWDYGGSDGEVFAVIHDGLTGKDMGGYAGRISDNDIWNVVNFIRTLSRVQGRK